MGWSLASGSHLQAFNRAPADDSEVGSILRLHLPVYLSVPHPLLPLQALPKGSKPARPCYIQTSSRTFIPVSSLIFDSSCHACMDSPVHPPGLTSCQSPARPPTHSSIQFFYTHPPMEAPLPWSSPIRMRLRATLFTSVSFGTPSSILLRALVSRMVHPSMSPYRWPENDTRLA